MKILHVIPSLSPSLGGPTNVALNLVRTLNQLGIKAEIATTNHGILDSLEAPIGQRINYIYDSENNLSVPVYFLPYTKPSLKEFFFPEHSLAGFGRIYPITV